MKARHVATYILDPRSRSLISFSSITGYRDQRQPNAGRVTMARGEGAEVLPWP
jgi:hypothetical protein